MMASSIIKEETKTIRHLECAFDTVSYQGLTLFTQLATHKKMLCIKQVKNSQSKRIPRLLLNVTDVMALHSAHTCTSTQVGLRTDDYFCS